LTKSARQQFYRKASAVTLLAFLGFARPTFGTIRYRVSVAHPEEHIFHVVLHVDTRENEKVLTVALPAWDALYQIRDFAYRVRDVRAFESGPQKVLLKAQKVDKQTWQISNPGSAAGDLIIEYSIEWDSPGPFSSQLNGHHAFMNLAEILMYVPDRRTEDAAISFDSLPDSWKTICELPAGKEANSYTAPTYDALVDAPVEAGKFDEFEFDSGGAHFRAVVDAVSYYKPSLEGALMRIGAYQSQLMGGLPFKEFTFIIHVGSYSETGSGGGMEHMNSTAIAAGSMEGVIYVAAHELFHVWNVKRIRPQSLEPVDRTKEQYTRALWFAEGVTDTYQNYTLLRTGLWSKEAFYEDLAGQVCDLQSRPARLWQSAEESSLDAWFEKYDFYNRPDRSIWYYNKGQILGVLLDIAIRDATDNRKSLDDVFRLMNDEFARQGRFYDDHEAVPAAVVKVSGKDFSEFFARYVFGTAEIPYDTFFSSAGLAFKIETFRTADLGFWAAKTLNGLAVSAVESGGKAEAAGVREGDILLEINGQAFPPRITEWLRDRSPGERVRLRIRRGGEEKEFTYALGMQSDNHCRITEAPHPSDGQQRIRDGLLRGSTD